MSFDLSSLMPLVAVIVSVCAIFFWDGANGKGDRIEKYIESRMLVQGHSDKNQNEVRLVRIEVEPGSRLKPTDLRARDKKEEALAA